MFVSFPALYTVINILWAGAFGQNYFMYFLVEKGHIPAVGNRFPYPTPPFPACQQSCLARPFAGPLLGFLATPTHPLEKIPDAGWVVGYPEMLLDHFSDPPQGPQFGRIAVLTCSLQQPLFQLIDLFFRQTARPSRRTVGLKERLALLFIGHTPLSYGSGRYANELSKSCVFMCTSITSFIWCKKFYNHLSFQFPISYFCFFSNRVFIASGCDTIMIVLGKGYVGKMFLE